MRQHTIATAVEAQGIGVHSGKSSRIVLRPAKENTGIIFKRVDIDYEKDIPAKVHFVTNTLMATTLGVKPHKVTMVEHLLSACSGLHIDNLIVEVDGEEMPIFDGSSAGYSTLLLEAGIKEQDANRMFLKVTKTVSVNHGDSIIRIDPNDKLEINFALNTDHPAFENNYNYTTDCHDYINTIAPARTFGYTSDLAKLLDLGLAKGASDQNCIPLDDYSTLVGKRFENEMIRHKVLDVIGDFYLLGYPIIAKITCYNSGHKTNNMVLKKLLSERSFDILIPNKSFTKKSAVYST